MDTLDQTPLFSYYPPRVIDQIEVSEQEESGTRRYVIYNPTTSRYFRLREPEYGIVKRLDGSRTLSQIAASESETRGLVIPLEALVAYVSKLDSLGLIARSQTRAAAKPASTEYPRFRVFNPERLLSSLDRRLGWALTRPIISATFLLMAVVALGLIMRSDEVTSYTAYVLSNYGIVTILLFTVLITAMHEFAHGLALKHFGGRVNEVGVLMIFYVLPALYCNVSDIYRLPRRSERVWVLAAGIYWQMVVSAGGALVWLISTPHTPLADLGFLLLAGGMFNVLINCNPLIKLDGYYALSQWLGINNLQARARAAVSSLTAKLVDGRRAAPSTVDRPVLLTAYWVLSVIYTVVLLWVVVALAGDWLMDRMGTSGVVLTLALALFLMRGLWLPSLKRFLRAVGRLPTLVKKAWLMAAGERLMKGNEVNEMSGQTAAGKSVDDAAEAGPQSAKPSRRRAVLKWAAVAVVVAVLVAPWEASTGSDCELLLPPGREAAARANVDAVLTEVYVQPGDRIAENERIASLANPEILDRLTELNGEIERLTANASRIEEELRVRSEMLLSASFREVDRKRLASELKDESARIAHAGESPARPLPASLAVLQSEIELKQTEVEHNQREVTRYKRLLEQGLVGEQQYDRAAAALGMSQKELQAARARLDAAVVDHRRFTSTTETASLIAETEARAARSSFEALIAEMHANRQQTEALRQRREILQREYDGMQILAPRSGVVLGEDIRKLIGRRYSRGEEILRIGELERFLLRVDVSEREIVNVGLDNHVRFKLKTVPGRTFTGRVSKINAEPRVDENGHSYYPVEVAVENDGGILRPGMTGFARVSFGRKPIGFILANKLWHSLRPELWLF